MGFLASLLPGLRELRAPLVSGLLWFAALYFVFSPDLAVTSTQDLGALFNAWDGAIVPAVVIGASYLLGSVAQTLVTPPLQWMGRAVRKVGLWLMGSDPYNFIEDKHGRLVTDRRPLWFFKAIEGIDLRTWPLSVTARGLLFDAVRNRLSKAGVPGHATLAFPYEAAVHALPHTAAQLSQTAPVVYQEYDRPVVYQEYDRLRAEADLRLAVSIPLIVLALASPLNWKIAVVTASVVVAIVLLLQAVDKLRESHDILANSAYLDYIVIPIVESVAGALGELDKRPASGGQWIGAIVVALEHKGFFEEADMALDDALGLNQQEEREEVEKYLSENSSQLAKRWRRRVEIVDDLSAA
ncbi:MAG: hypothetical protein LC776_12610 [Acidobacteria bacterium]|nr:hypothetical protein [Acidobacteriota bacterium]